MDGQGSGWRKQAKFVFLNAQNDKGVAPSRGSNIKL